MRCFFFLCDIKNNTDRQCSVLFIMVYKSAPAVIPKANPFIDITDTEKWHPGDSLTPQHGFDKWFTIGRGGCYQKKFSAVSPDSLTA